MGAAERQKIVKREMNRSRYFFMVYFMDCNKDNQNNSLEKAFIYKMSPCYKSEEPGYMYPGSIFSRIMSQS